jgi:hypothetical protein
MSGGSSGDMHCGVYCPCGRWLVTGGGASDTTLGGPNGGMSDNTRGGPNGGMSDNTRGGPSGGMVDNTRGGPNGGMVDGTRGDPSGDTSDSSSDESSIDSSDCEMGSDSSLEAPPPPPPPPSTYFARDGVPITAAGAVDYGRLRASHNLALLARMLVGKEEGEMAREIERGERLALDLGAKAEVARRAAVAARRAVRAAKARLARVIAAPLKRRR